MCLNRVPRRHIQRQRNVPRISRMLLRQRTADNVCSNEIPSDSGAETNRQSVVFIAEMKSTQMLVRRVGQLYYQVIRLIYDISECRLWRLDLIEFHLNFDFVWLSGEELLLRSSSLGHSKNSSQLASEPSAGVRGAQPSPIIDLQFWQGNRQQKTHWPKIQRLAFYCFAFIDNRRR